MDGLGVGAPLSGGGVSGYMPDIANAQEVTFTTSGGLGEAEVGGPTMNIVPKTGGNTVRGNLYAPASARGMVGSNYTDELQAAGLRAPGELLKLWDFTAGVGGPISRIASGTSRTSREEGSWQSVPGMYRNQNAGDPTKFIYVPDLTKQAATAGSWRIANVRLTVQPTPRNRFNVFWDEQHPCQGSSWPGTDDGCRQQPDDEWIIGGAPGSAGTFGLATATQAPEISNYAGRGMRVSACTQGTWTSPLTNRLLLDAGIRHQLQPLRRAGDAGQPARADSADGRTVRRRAPANAVPNACAHGIQNLTFASQDWASNQGFVLNVARLGVVRHRRAQHEVRLPGRRITGSTRATSATTRTSPTASTNGVPESADDGSEAVQDRTAHAMGSAVCAGAVDARPHDAAGRAPLRSRVELLPRSADRTREVPADGVHLPSAGRREGYNDITPRGGAAYDVFGNGKTSLKVNVGKYLEAATNHNTYSLTNPAARIAGSPVLGAPPPVTRAWTDANGNYMPDCDLLDPNAQDLTASGGDICGAVEQPELRQAGLQRQLRSRRCSKGGACGRATGRSASRFSRR